MHLINAMRDRLLDKVVTGTESSEYLDGDQGTKAWEVVIRKTTDDASLSSSDHLPATGAEDKVVRSAPKWLIYRWATGQPAEQIARETGLEIKVIYRMLKELEKSIISLGETDSSGSESVLKRLRNWPEIRSALVSREQNRE